MDFIGKELNLFNDCYNGCDGKTLRKVSYLNYIT